jgi:hypothetical protein
MLLLAGLTIALRLALLSSHPVPTPQGADDYSYLLLGDTLAHFRLANPTHPLHRFFETNFVLQQPSYSSIYPLGPALALASWTDRLSPSLGGSGPLRGRVLRALLLDAARLGDTGLGTDRRVAGSLRVRSAVLLDELLLGRRGFGGCRMSGLRRVCRGCAITGKSAMRSCWASASVCRCCHGRMNRSFWTWLF